MKYRFTYNYLGYVNSKEFIKDFSEVKKDKVQIIFEIVENAPKMLLELCQKIMPWAEDNGAFFSKTKEGELNEFI